MNSSRLPGKVMLDLCGKTVLAHVVDRVLACERVDEVVVATTEHPHDQRIVAEAENLGVRVYRGSEDDVLERFFKAAKKFDAEILVRVTADCPLFDPRLLTRMYAEFERISLADSPNLYLSNTRIRTYPRGLDAEIFNFPALELAHKEARQAFEREHVTPYMYQHPKKFALYSFKGGEDFSDFRWTLDTPEDYQFFEAVCSELHENGRIFSTEEVMGLLRDQPQLIELNAHVRQKNIKHIL